MNYYHGRQFILSLFSGIEVSIIENTRRFRVTIGQNVFCSCTPSQRADRKVCSHSIWILLNLFKLAEDNLEIAQVYLAEGTYRRITAACPDNAPDHLLQCLEKTNRKRAHHPRISNHAQFEKEQTWYLERKKGSRSARCSGCLTKGIIKDGTVHATMPTLFAR